MVGTSAMRWPLIRHSDTCRRSARGVIDNRHRRHRTTPRQVRLIAMRSRHFASKIALADAAGARQLPRRGVIYKRHPSAERAVSRLQRDGTKNMMLLYGLAAFGVMWWLSKVFVRSDTKAVAKAVKIVGGVLALGAGGPARHEGPHRHGAAARRVSRLGARDGAASNCRFLAQAGQRRAARACPVGDDRDGDRPTFRRGIGRTCSRALLRAAVSAISTRHPCARFMRNAALSIPRARLS